MKGSGEICTEPSVKSGQDPWRMKKGQPWAPGEPVQVPGLSTLPTSECVCFHCGKFRCRPRSKSNTLKGTEAMGH